MTPQKKGETKCQSRKRREDLLKKQLMTATLDDLHLQIRRAQALTFGSDAVLKFTIEPFNKFTNSNVKVVNKYTSNVRK